MLRGENYLTYYLGYIWHIYIPPKVVWHDIKLKYLELALTSSRAETLILKASLRIVKSG